MKARRYRFLLIILMLVALAGLFGGCSVSGPASAPLPGRTPTVSAEEVVILRFIRGTLSS